MKRNFNTEAHLRALSLLVFCPERSDESVHHVAGLDEAGRQEFFRLADAHHVVIRALEPLQRKARIIGDGELVKITQSLREREHDRIAKALMYLERVCARIKAAGCEVTVIKTLDHWPDFGSDLDLFTNGDERRLVHVLIAGAPLHANTGGPHCAQAQFCCPRIARARGAARQQAWASGRAY